MLVGRLLSFWEGKFWGPVLSIGGVVTWRRFKRHRDTMPPCCLIFLMFMHLATLETGTRILAVLSNRTLAKGWHFVWVEVRLKQWLRWRHWIWICRPWKFNWWGKNHHFSSHHQLIRYDLLISLIIQEGTPNTNLSCNWNSEVIF